MPIAALSQDTSRAITSSLALNDAVSVIKELIDNALDARASAMSIEISSNTLDTIQIKDNGGGIGIEDRQLLCRRGCTSKIRTIDDIACLGGTFLGFRGEALASVADLSDSVIITTRIEGEVVGTALKYAEEGKLVSSSSASHPVGTTVRIQGFLTKLPVRRQTALSAPNKTLAALRKLLTSYAFARPECRLSFKVLKDKYGKGSWSYAGSAPGVPLPEIASKLIGKDIPAQCKGFAHLANKDENLSNNTWTVEALLLNVDSDLKKSTGFEQYFSVDGRPVNCDREMMRNLAKLYKAYLKSACSKFDIQSCPSRPFIYVRISCPLGSYDVNVEPAKNILKFNQTSTLVEMFEALLVKAYGEKAEEVTKTRGAQSVNRGQARTIPFELLMARPSSPHATATEESGVEQGQHGPREHEGTGSARIYQMQATMDTTCDIYLDHPEKTDVSETEADGTPTESSNNPWTLAKLNVVLSPKSGSDPTDGSNGRGNVSFTAGYLASSSSESLHPSVVYRTPLRTSRRLPSPETAPHPSDEGYQNPGPPSQVMRRWNERREDDNREPERASQISQSPTMLDIWVEQPQAAGQRALAQQLASQTWSNGQMTPGRMSLHLKTKSPKITPEVDLTQQRLTQPHTNPFTTPVKRTPAGNLSDGTPFIEQRDADVHQLQANPSSPGLAKHTSASMLVSESNQRDLAEILAFEQQKREAIAHQRLQTARNLKNRPANASLGNAVAASQESSTIHTQLELDEYDPDTMEVVAKRFSQKSCQSSERDHNSPSNPHRNHSLAAIRGLGTKTGTHVSAAQPTQQMEFDVLAEVILKIPESDPRGYLISHSFKSAKQIQAGGQAAPTSGLKIKRTKTTRLPLESIPIGEVTYGLIATIDATPYFVRDRIIQFAKVDEYAATGQLRHVDWETRLEFSAFWQDRLKSLLVEQFEGVSALAELESEERNEGYRYEIDLRSMLDRHIDLLKLEGIKS